MIAIYRQHSAQGLSELQIIDETAKHIQTIMLPEEYFYDLYWLSENVVGLISPKGVYIVFIQKPEESYWVPPKLDSQEIQISIVTILEN